MDQAGRSMNILLIGNGAREHAIAWKLRQSPRVDALFVAPGNAGTAAIATNLPVAATDIPGLAKVAGENRIDLTVVGPEAPLAGGLVDRFQELGLLVFGPTQAAAQIEASKGFAKELMGRYGIPCAQSLTFDYYAEARHFIEQHDVPLVVKADGLAAGKGVTIAGTRREALAAVYACLEEGAFGSAGERVIIEEWLDGREVSVFAFTDGEALSPLVAACDYKRAHDGDRGPNTGGMGSYSPPEFWNPALAREVESRILRPTVQALALEGRRYKGVLYGGLMLTREGPKALEFNCRLGDPETQVILPLLETDLVDIMEAVAQGDLTKTSIEWSDDACVGVVVASGGYPGEYETGMVITGLDTIPGEALLFHAGTKLAAPEDPDATEVVTDGGRVLTVVARGPSMTAARERAYSATRRVHFQGAFYRGDIALHLRDAAVAEA